MGGGGGEYRTLYSRRRGYDQKTLVKTDWRSRDKNRKVHGGCRIRRSVRTAIFRSNGRTTRVTTSRGTGRGMHGSGRRTSYFVTFVSQVCLGWLTSLEPL